MKIFVMAQGEGSRWVEDRERGIIAPEYEFKQVLPITEELNLISRTLKQFQYWNTTVICSDEMLKYLPDGTITYPLKDPVGCLLYGMWSLKPFWDSYDSIIYLLGDVAYSHYAVYRIISCSEDLTFFGRLGSNKVTGKEAREVFAVSVGRSRHEEFESNLASLFEDGKAKLWDYYEEYSPNFVEIDDYTDDTDSIPAYDKFWDKLQESIRKDDEENKI